MLLRPFGSYAPLPVPSPCSLLRAPTRPSASPSSPLRLRFTAMRPTRVGRAAAGPSPAPTAGAVRRLAALLALFIVVGRRRHLLEQPQRAVHLGRSDRNRHQPDDPAPVAALGSAHASARNAGRRTAARQPVVRDQLRVRRPARNRLSRRQHRDPHRLCAPALRHRPARRWPAAHARRLRARRQHRARRRAALDGASAAKRGRRLRHAAQRIADGAVLPADAVRRDSRQAIARETPSQPPGLRPARARVADAVGRRVRVRHGVEGIDGGRAARRGRSTTARSSSTRSAKRGGGDGLSTQVWRRHGSCSARSSGSSRDRPSARR